MFSVTKFRYPLLANKICGVWWTYTYYHSTHLHTFCINIHSTVHTYVNYGTYVPYNYTNVPYKCTATHTTFNYLNWLFKWNPQLNWTAMFFGGAGPGVGSAGELGLDFFSIRTITMQLKPGKQITALQKSLHTCTPFCLARIWPP
jgi:hypothetical protein